MEKSLNISFIIKALNEEGKIAKCIESCLREAQPYSSEIILVDSLSTDRTVEIAKQYPIDIVQFSNQEDIGCAAAVQLGYQSAKGEYIYLIDGDMECCPGFLSEAMNFLITHEDVAGVSGLIVDTQVHTSADKKRIKKYSKIKKNTEVISLGGGGMYRRAYVDEIGYLAHSGLPACEEAELGVRLKNAGRRLIRFPTPAVFHTGHVESELQLLKRLWMNGRLGAHGQFLRSAIGHKWWWSVVKLEWFIFVPIIMFFLSIFISLLLSLMLEVGFFIGSSVFFCLWGGLFFFLMIIKKSIAASLLSIFVWHISLFASVKPFFSELKDPNEIIKSTKN